MWRLGFPERRVYGSEVAIMKRAPPPQTGGGDRMKPSTAVTVHGGGGWAEGRRVGWGGRRLERGRGGHHGDEQRCTAGYRRAGSTAPPLAPSNWLARVAVVD